ncbi:hypothetical protein RHSP_66736 [Rhizobium freirei PRF 81]|uniref:Uncharacterized protein n=1 Tax=Rhizobium freirei PRF 81 TaxID=363754 RepID=N6UA05_9HYPH|nr:hypothetical protein RHSP_66736 [Rhizobium freirei PRF 81]
MRWGSRSDRLPAILFAGAVDGVDDLLVELRAFERHDFRALAEGGGCEGFRLASVLAAVREAEDLRFRVVAIGQFQFFRAIAIGIEGRLHLDEAFRAVEDHDLTIGHLRRDVEAKLEVAEIGLDAGIDVGAEFRIALRYRLNAQGFAAGDETGADCRIDADIGQAAAAKSGDIAHIASIAVEIGEGALDMAQAADGAIGEQRADFPPDRRIGDHIGFHHQHLVAITGGNQAVDFIRLERDRLFAKHMLAGVRRLDGPFDMLRGRQGNIDGVDGVGGEHLLIGAEGMRHGKAVRHLPGAIKIAAGDCGDDAIFRILNGGDDQIAADLRRRQNSETQHALSPEASSRTDGSMATIATWPLRRDPL